MKLREEGNKLYGNSQYEMAVAKYSAALALAPASKVCVCERE